MHLTLKLLSLILFFYLAAPFCLKQTGKLIMTEIRSKRPFNPLFETRPVKAEEQAEVDKALSQKYTYFGCGGQAFVFFSEDGNYVVKFFKQKHFREPRYLNYVPFISKYRERKFEKRRVRMETDYGSYRIGFDEFQPQTGLLYVHLNKTDYLRKELTLIDKLGIVHKVDLDKTDFIIQKRAELVLTTLEKQMESHDEEAAKRTIDEVVKLILTRCQKGYRDRDPNIATNCGILEGKAIKIDVGRLTYDPNMKKPLYYKPELYHLTRPFRIWLQHHYPTLTPYLDEQITHVIAD